MTEMILPNVYIEVRPEGLIIPGRVTVGNLGVIGTASKGPIGEAVILGSYAEAQERFGRYDPWDPEDVASRLTLVRALEQAYAHGAGTVFAVRISSRDTDGEIAAQSADYVVQSQGGECVRLTANSPGTWGNDLSINIAPAEENGFVEDEKHQGDEGLPITLTSTPVVENARNRIRLYKAATGVTRSLEILYDDGALNANQVRLNPANGELTFGETLEDDDEVIASYVVDSSNARKVILRLGRTEEVYTVVSGDDLVADINQSPAGSALVTAEALGNASELPSASEPDTAFASFGSGSNASGTNGESGPNYQDGLDVLLNQPVHIIVAAGQDEASIGNRLDAHCQVASSDLHRRERIAVVGSRLGATVDQLRGHNLASDRLIFVAPGIKVTDAAATPPVEVTLSGAYAAAAVAGLLAGFSAHISPTNKTLRVGGLERKFTSAELSQLVQSRVLALEERQGFRIVKGITTATNTAWHQITTRRIVDFAKFGVRSAALPYIGLLNNERVRGAMRATINSFLTEMVNDEKLISYELDVTATREEERQGIARVTIVLRPVFSIDFIKVTMFLE